MSWHLLHFMRTDAARYLSHLDTARALRRTFARADVPIALSRGMRPKPHLSLVLPLPVGAAGLDERAVVELVETSHGGDRLARLRGAAPDGIGIVALDEAATRPRPVAVSADYACALAVVADRLAPEAAWFETQERVLVERTSPKGTKTIDLRRYVTGISVRGSRSGSRLEFTVRYERDGAARPEEFVRLLAVRAGADPVMRDLVRTRVVCKESRAHQ